MGNRVTIKLKQTPYTLGDASYVQHEVEVSDDQGSDCFDCELPDDLLNAKKGCDDLPRLFAWLATALVDDAGEGLDKVRMLLGWRGVTVKTPGGEYGWFDAVRTVEEVAASADSLDRATLLENALPAPGEPLRSPRPKL